MTPSLRARLKAAGLPQRCSINCQPHSRSEQNSLFFPPHPREFLTLKGVEKQTLMSCVKVRRAGNMRAVTSRCGVICALAHMLFHATVMVMHICCLFMAGRLEPVSKWCFVYSERTKITKMGEKKREVETPEGMWRNCELCQEIIYSRNTEQHYYHKSIVCVMWSFFCIF